MENTYVHTQLSWEDYKEIVIRRRWWLLGPFFLSVLVAFALAQVWPRLYRSEALILVEQQKVPEQYVTPNVVAAPQDRLQSMTQQILSRTRLRRLIEQFGLYPEERSRMTMDELIDKMRERIRIELVQVPGRPAELTAFRVYFLAESPLIAQQIANELTSLFIEENLQARTQQSAGTTEFLENQLEQARKDLARQEERQRKYKMQYLGQLPEQQQANLQILGSLDGQLRASLDAMERAEQQKIYLESMDAEYSRMRQSLEEQGQNSSASRPSLRESKNRLTELELRSQLAELEAKYTPRHPDVVRVREQLARLQSQNNAESETAGDTKKETGASAAVSSIEPSLADVQSRRKAITAEIDSRKKDVEELRQKIQTVQDSIALTPVREQQLAEIIRSYDNARENYQSLLQKKLQSELATNLEKRQQGEQFRILDPANLPQKPSEPNPVSMVLIGWLFGISAGVGLTTLREITDKTMRSEKEVRQLLQLPVLVNIPLLYSPAGEIRQQWLRRMEWAGVALGVLLSLTTGLYTYWVS